MKKSQLCKDLEEQCSKQRNWQVQRFCKKAREEVENKCAGRRGGQVKVGERGAGAK